MEPVAAPEPETAVEMALPLEPEPAAQAVPEPEPGPPPIVERPETPSPYDDVETPAILRRERKLFQ